MKTLAKFSAVACFAVMALLISGAGCNNKTADMAPVVDTSSWATYSDSVNKFSLKYPPAWEKREPTATSADVFNAVKFLLPTVSETGEIKSDFFVGIDKSGAKETALSDYADQNLAALREMDGYETIVDFKSATVAGLPAKTIIFRRWLSLEQQRINMMQTIVIKDGIAYVLNYRANTKYFDGDMDEIDAVVSSFKFK